MGFTTVHKKEKNSQTNSIWVSIGSYSDGRFGLVGFRDGDDGLGKQERSVMGLVDFVFFEVGGAEVDTGAAFQ